MTANTPQHINFLKLFATGLAVSVTSCAALAFTFEKPNERQSFSMDGSIPIVHLKPDSYSVYEVPTVAPKLELSTTTETHSELKSKLKMGELVTDSEAIEVLEVYFKNTAFDYDSIKIRNFKVGGQTYVTWCGEYLFVCLEWKGGAGTLVQYESNGRNRSGGMTGFKPTTLLIRKIPGQSTTPAKPIPISVPPALAASSP